MFKKIILKEIKNKFFLKKFQLQSYNYFLAKEKIAQVPTLPVHNAKLLVCKKKGKKYYFNNKKFIDLIDILDQNTILFFNKTKVFKARIILTNIFCIKKSGKQLFINGEIFVYKIIDKNIFEGLVSDDKNYKPGNIINYTNNIQIKILELTNSGILFEIKGIDILTFLEQNGRMPLPPYIKYGKYKEQRYQTNFANKIGSSAAPTASLHFSKFLLDKLKEKNIITEFETLHVGLGTFRPVYSKNILNHKIHSEELLINIKIFEKIMKYKQSGKKILAVGTTMTRFLESLPYIWKILENKNMIEKIGEKTIKYRDKITQKISIENALKIISLNNLNKKNINFLDISFNTKLFIYPGFKRKIVNQIITNFHLPKSSLLMLVAGWMGRKNALNSYQYAIKNNYSFYSFGDGMIILE